MLQTMDYDKFKISGINRRILPLQVEKIKKSIEKVGFKKYNPIVVNENMEILDGQHRFTALKQLNLPIVYEIETGDTSDTSDTMVELNATQKQWTLTDYIDHYAGQGKVWYVFFNYFKNKYKLNQTSALAILIGTDSKAPGIKVKNGEGFKQLDYAEFLGGAITQMSEMLDFAKSRSFVRAVVKLYITGGEKEVKKLIDKMMIIRKCINTRDYCTQFEHILNKGRAIKNHISI